MLEEIGAKCEGKRSYIETKTTTAARMREGGGNIHTTSAISRRETDVRTFRGTALHRFQSDKLRSKKKKKKLKKRYS